jgi:hypothetical protein
LRLIIIKNNKTDRLLISFNVNINDIEEKDDGKKVNIIKEINSFNLYKWKDNNNNSERAPVKGVEYM